MSTEPVLADTPWLTSDEAAAYAKVNLRTVQDACNRNELRHCRLRGKPGNPIRTKREWIDRWLEGGVRGGQAA